jgi:hypothetical protein
VISNSDLLSVELNLDINNIYNLVNENSSITDFGKNDASNFETILLYFIKPNKIYTNLIEKIRFLFETFQQRCMSE